MRKILTGFVALTMALFLCGCACTGTVGTATPSPTGKATTSPAGTMGPSGTAGGAQSPEGSMGSGSQSPEASTSPDAGGAAGGESASIPGFEEGKKVDVTQAPKVKETIEKQFAGAEIVSIKHALQNAKQVYAVTYKVSGNEKTVYIAPDGTLVEGSTSSSPSPSASSGT